MKDDGLECETCLHSLDEEACEMCQNHDRWTSLDEVPPPDEIDWYPEDIEEDGSYSAQSTTVAP